MCIHTHIFSVWVTVKNPGCCFSSAAPQIHQIFFSHSVEKRSSCGNIRLLTGFSPVCIHHTSPEHFFTGRIKTLPTRPISQLEVCVSNVIRNKDSTDLVSPHKSCASVLVNVGSLGTLVSWWWLAPPPPHLDSASIWGSEHHALTNHLPARWMTQLLVVWNMRLILSLPTSRSPATLFTCVCNPEKQNPSLINICSRLVETGEMWWVFVKNFGVCSPTLYIKVKWSTWTCTEHHDSLLTSLGNVSAIVEPKQEVPSFSPK